MSENLPGSPPGRPSPAWLLLALAIAGPSWGVCPPPPGPTPAPVPYPDVPDWESVHPGYCGTGLAFADLDNDGFKDMIVSNGNDIARQKLFVFYNRRNGCFDVEPSWQSADDAYNGNLAVGDIDKNGWLDVAVSIYTGPEHTYTGGGAKVYLNDGPPNYLRKTPSWSVTGFPSFNLSLGDVNGDARLDLAVAVGNAIPETETFAAQPDCQSPYLRKTREASVVGQEPPFVSNGFIFLNDGKGLERQPGWLSNNKIISMDVEFADVNKDGNIDLIYGDPQPMVFLGDGRGLARTPGWTSTQASYFSNQLDFAATLDLTATNPKARVSSLLVAGNNYLGGGPGRFDLYRFDSSYIIDYEPRTSSPSWSSPKGGWGSGVLFADVNHDGKLDLLAGRWAMPASGVLGAPVEIYLGDGVTFAETPAYVSKTSSVLEILAVADLRNKALRTVTERLTPPEGASWAVLTLNRQNVENLLAVSIDGRRLSPREYATVPGKNVIYLGQRLETGHTAEVTYQDSPVLDLGATNWDCSKGDYIFYSRYPG